MGDHPAGGVAAEDMEQDAVPASCTAGVSVDPGIRCSPKPGFKWHGCDRHTQCETQAENSSYRGPKAGDSGPGYNVAERVECGPVTRAVPRLLNAVPGYNATEVRANGRAFV